MSPQEARQQLAYIPENVALYPQLTDQRTHDRQMGGAQPATASSADSCERAGLTAAQIRRPIAGYSRACDRRWAHGDCLRQEGQALLGAAGSRPPPRVTAARSWAGSAETGPRSS